jgi:hypothetical protein
MKFVYNPRPPSQWTQWPLDGLDLAVASVHLLTFPLLFVIFRRWEFKNLGTFRPVFYGFLFGESPFYSVMSVICIRLQQRHNDVANVRTVTDHA